MEDKMVLTGTDGAERVFHFNKGGANTNGVSYFKWVNGNQFGAVQCFRKNKKPSHMSQEQFDLVQERYTAYRVWFDSLTREEQKKVCFG